MSYSTKILERSIDPATHEMLEHAERSGIETIWDRFDAMQPACGFGELGLCCRNCAMGPCRIGPFEETGPNLGVCGADRDVIVARFLDRMIAAGSASHSDHGRDIAHTFLLAAQGKAGDYKIRDEAKLKAIASELGIPVNGYPIRDVAVEVGKRMLAEFGQQEGELLFSKRAPQKRQELWKTLKIAPRGIDREVVETMHRTHIGVDNDPVNLVLQGLRTALADGWGGSMIATELSDVMFGTPTPRMSAVNLGVLKHDEVNIMVHGHEPTLSELIVAASRDPELVALAKKFGAKDINVVGICCTGNEVLMRQGIPSVGNYIQQELAVATGAVEAIVVDVQCILPSLGTVAGCFHTKFITTSPKAKFKGATHVEFDEKRAYEIARTIVRTAVENYRFRKAPMVHIPEVKTECMVGFSVEAIVKALGGTLKPLIDAIAQKQIRGIAAVVGCNNPRVKHDYSHVNLVKELVKRDILVVTTGCNAIACAKVGLLLPKQGAEMAGLGLRAVCQALGIPPVLHMGSCVDNSRILVACSAIANALGVDISDLPAAAAAPEWMSEKAVAIGAYAVASGVFTVLGIMPPVLGGPAVTDLLVNGAEGVVGAKFAVEPDPFKAADLIETHINNKRRNLGLPV
jgi:anaerobic carbon-monoxide dehydrogenase catalytic subunit